VESRSLTFSFLALRLLASWCLENGPLEFSNGDVEPRDAEGRR
jgi:hypothetical protein